MTTVSNTTVKLDSKAKKPTKSLDALWSKLGL